MNERIRELAKQAGMQYCYTDMYDDSEFDYKKFAELIVRECVDKTFDSEKGIGTTRWKTEVMAELKEHFGIES